MPAGLKEAAVIRKLRKFTPTPFKAKDSVYDKRAADNAVSFIECLAHTKGYMGGKAVPAHRLAGTDHPRCIWNAEAQRIPPVQHGVHRNTKEEWKV